MLFPFDEGAEALLGRRHLKNVQAIKSYYLVKGRNAWHGNWVKTFEQDQLFFDLDSAKESAEERRNCGNVFYIEELPTVVLTSNIGDVIISEVNTDEPLKGFDCSSDLFRLRTPIAKAAKSFDYYGNHWNSPPPNPESLFVLFDYLGARQYEPLGDHSLTKWTSYSSGGQYRLGWVEESGRFASSAILKLVRQAKRQPRKIKRTSVGGVTVGSVEGIVPTGS